MNSAAASTVCQFCQPQTLVTSSLLQVLYFDTLWKMVWQTSALCCNTFHTEIKKQTNIFFYYIYSHLSLWSSNLQHTSTLAIGYEQRGSFLICIRNSSVCNLRTECYLFISDSILLSGQSYFDYKTLIDEKCFVKMCFLCTLYPVADRSMQSILSGNSVAEAKSEGLLKIAPGMLASGLWLL